MPATLEAPPAANPGIAALEAQLPAETVQALNDHMARLDAPEQEAAPETPLPETPVEPPEAEAPEAEVTPASPTPGEAKPNESARQPASWQPDEVARQAAKNLGLPDEVVRGISSPEEFSRLLQMAAAMGRPQAAPSPPAPEKPKEPSALEKFLSDPLQDPDTVAAVKAVHERNAAIEQQLQQLSQGTQAHHQQLAEQRQREVTQLFDRTADELGFEPFGKSESLTPEQIGVRTKVFQTLYAMHEARLATDVSNVSVEQAFALAYPTEFKEQLRRQTVSAARSQADQRLTAGRSTAPPRTPPSPDGPATDPQVKEWLEKAKRGELTRDG